MPIVLRRLLSDPIARVCLGFLGAVALLGLLVPVLPVADPTQIDLSQKYLPPSAAHWAGTDVLGRDIFSRLLWGIRSTFFVSVLTMLVTAAIGALYGSLSGALRGRGDAVLMRAADIMMAFPSEVLILAIVGMLGPGLSHVVLACVLAKWAWYARMMRGIVRGISDSGFVRFARVSGASTRMILFRHLIPGAAGEFFVLMTLDTGSVVLMISALSFLGLGVQPPAAEWGMMLAETKEVLSLYPAQMLPPGLAILSVVTAFNFLGDSLRDAFDLRHAGKGAGR